MEQFHYMLNAFERSAQADSPADAGYAEKRKALIEHLTALNKDAERYRWLRDKGIEHDWTVCRYPIEGSGVYQQTRQSLDAAIDAAMAGANS